MNIYYFDSIETFETTNGQKPKAIVISTNEFERIIKSSGSIRPIQGFTISDVQAVKGDELEDGRCILLP